MATTYDKVYVFVNDTAFFNKEFGTSPTIVAINQGSCFASDKVRNMFGTPAFVQDPRSARGNTKNILSLDEEFKTTELGQKLASENNRLNGQMSFVLDKSQYVSEIVDALNNGSDIMQRVFSYIELMGNYQRCTSETGRESAAYTTIAATDYAKSIAGETNPVIEVVVAGSNDEYQAINNVYFKNVVSGTSDEYKTKMIIRKKVIIRFKLNERNIELHAFWNEAFFTDIDAGNYPLTTITDVVFPCHPDNLFNLLDNYKTVSEFATASSAYRNAEIDRIISGGDQTGVANFATTYFAYPDRDPNVNFILNFALVFKGARPTDNQMREAIIADIKVCKPQPYDEDAWRKKLPGLFSDYAFFMIPLYDKVVTDTSSNTHRLGICDYHSFKTMVSKMMGELFAEEEPNFQIVMPLRTVMPQMTSKYQVLAFPHYENSEDAKSLLKQYPDFMGGLSTFNEAASHQSDTTNAFNVGFDETLSKADANQEVATVAGVPANLKWAKFSIGTISYYILSRHSYEEAINN